MPETLPILVVGGGPAGLAAARGIADVGYQAVLVESRTKLGGTPIHSNYAALTPDFRSAEEAMGERLPPSRTIPISISGWPRR